MAEAIEEIRAECDRQINREGWTPEHDDKQHGMMFEKHIT